MTRQEAKQRLSKEWNKPKAKNANGKEPRDYSVIYNCYEVLKK